jgi:hypothetical protein
MADVIQTPGPTSSGGSSAAGWAVAVIILLAVVAWFIFGGGIGRQTTYRADVKITPPGQTAPSGGSASGEVTRPTPPPSNPRP